jgi:molybdopterin-containing oxidoreductase family iron-sulfur binding subunit
MERREFLHLLGLFSGTTLLSACGPESGQNKLISYLVPPDEGVTPGEALWYPATCTECPAGCGLQARVREGRPVKVEGIPEHPISGGGLCVRGQASLWRLYHPQRLRSPMLRDAQGGFNPIPWEEAFERIGKALAESRKEEKRSIYLSGRTTGSLSEQIDRFCADLDIERLPEFEIFGHAALRKAYGLLFQQDELPHYRIASADFLLTLGADLLETFVSPVDFAGQFAARKGKKEFHWVHVEPHISLTGVNADERLVLAPGSEPYLLLWLIRTLNDENALRRPLSPAIRSALPELSAAEAARRTGLTEDHLISLKTSLQRAKMPLVLAGGVSTAGGEGLATALLAGLLQWGCGAIGETVDFSRSENYSGVGSMLTLKGLAERLAEGEIGVLFVSRANPAFHAPPALVFAERLRGAALRVGITDLLDETTREFDLLLPPSHSLESWGDAEPRRGVRTLIRPAIRPLHDTRSEGDILLGLRRAGGKGGLPENYQAWLFERWRGRYSVRDLGHFADRGYLEEEVPPVEISLAEDAAGVLRQWKPAEGSGPSSVLVVAPSIRRYDGRSRPLQLLGEVPDPLTTVSYGEWVSISAKDARRLGLKEGDGIRLDAGEWSMALPAKVQPGLAEGVYVIQRDLLKTAPPGFDPETGEASSRLLVRVKKSAEHTQIAALSGSLSQKGRGIVPDPVHRKEEHKRASLYPEHEHPEHRWAMAIDLSLCTGCGACAAGCYVENNVPLTGRDEHLRGREMSWLRIEPFYDDAGRPEFVPMLCQHCHYAPCEPVCPVYAAYHNPEGLNVQVYNRCVGTRYCSNNCPYKVRRFNWWTHKPEKPLDLMRNPDLSVRTKGVMEKCTFCIQRIRAAKDHAKDEGRAVKDGEVVTACAQSCPTGAIVFGDLLDKNSRVSRLTESERVHRVFEELGTEPSVYYLSGVRSEE